MHITRWQHHTAVGLHAEFPPCLQALPIFLDRLVSPVTAIVLSVTVVLVFGERGPARCRFKPALLMHQHNRHRASWPTAWCPQGPGCSSMLRRSTLWVSTCMPADGCAPHLCICAANQHWNCLQARFSPRQCASTMGWSLGLTQPGLCASSCWPLPPSRGPSARYWTICLARTIR